MEMKGERDFVPRKFKAESNEYSGAASSLAKRLCSEKLHLLLECMYEDMCLLYSWHAEIDRLEQKAAMEELRRKEKEEIRRKRLSRSQSTTTAASGPDAERSVSLTSVERSLSLQIPNTHHPGPLSPAELHSADIEKGKASAPNSSRPSRENVRGEPQSSDGEPSFEDTDPNNQSDRQVLSDEAHDDVEDEDSHAQTAGLAFKDRKHPKVYGDGERSMAAWIAYAEVAERLKRPADAETAYRNCLKQGQSRRAWRGLLELYAENGHMRESLICVTELVRMDETSYPYRSDAPKCVLKALLKLIGIFGLSEVQQEFEDMGCKDGCKEYVSRFFHSATLWKVKGYDL